VGFSSDRDGSEEPNVVIQEKRPGRWRAGARCSLVITAVASTLGIAGCAITGLDGFGTAHDPEPGPPAASPEGGAPSSAGSEAASTHRSEWALVVDEDFSTTAELGHFADVYPTWASYDGFFDTRGYGVYDRDRVVSVQDGILTQHMEATSSGRAALVSITPPPHVQTYGRYEVRFRADEAPGYKIAWLLWPDDDNWANGEVNFPEVWLHQGQTIEGFSHQIGDPDTNAFVVDTGQPFDTWHTAVIEWRPESLTFSLDGVTHRTTDPHAIPSVPMFWSLQTEASWPPDPGTSGTVQIDYVRAWSYVPPAPSEEESLDPGGRTP